MGIITDGGYGELGSGYGIGIMTWVEELTPAGITAGAVWAAALAHRPKIIKEAVKSSFIGVIFRVFESFIEYSRL